MSLPSGPHQCAGCTQKGTRCKKLVRQFPDTDGNVYCWLHSKDNRKVDAAKDNRILPRRLDEFEKGWQLFKRMQCEMKNDDGGESKTSLTAAWFDNNKYTQYNPADVDLFEDYLQRDSKYDELRFETGDEYLIDFCYFLQINKKTGYCRSIAIRINDTVYKHDQPVQMPMNDYKEKYYSQYTMPNIIEVATHVTDEAKKKVTDYVNQFIDKENTTIGEITVEENPPAPVSAVADAYTTSIVLKVGRVDDMKKPIAINIVNPTDKDGRTTIATFATHHTNEVGLAGIIAEDGLATRPGLTRCGFVQPNPNDKEKNVQGKVFGFGAYLTRMPTTDEHEEVNWLHRHSQYGGSGIEEANRMSAVLIFKIYHREDGVEPIDKDSERMTLSPGKQVGLCPDNISIVIPERFLRAAVLEYIVFYTPELIN